MKKIPKIALLLLVLSGGSYAAQVTLTAKYGKTGGLAGNLNSVGNVVNGRNICPAANDNANGTPGCDMSDDPGLNDNGTPNDPSDDYYTGDMIVRTNDSFEAIAAYSWNGNAGGNEEQVTITGTLPAGTGFIWDGIPGSCKLPDSTLSADKKTITCVKKDFDTNDVGSFAEDLPFAVKVEGDATNGSKPGYISFTVDTPNNDNPPATDTTQTANPSDEDKIIVTASPRWNIDKHGGAGYYTMQYGQTNPNTNEKGWVIWYNFMIEVDEVPGETDDPINPSLGNEALQGGADATVDFTDDLSQIAPHAVLATWSSNGCDMTHSNSDEPYASPNATYPDRSISAPNGPLAVTCTQSGTDVSMEVKHVDGTLTNAPIKNMNGGLLPVNRKIAAIGTIRVFVPLSDVEKGADGQAGTADDGELTTKNCLKDFAPKGISGTSNFNGAEESTKDNCRNITLYASRGSWSKSYRRGWSDTATQQAQWGGGSWWLPPTDASIVQAGDGTANPGSLWGTYNYYGNAGGTDIDNPMICDVIDIETYELAILDTVDDPATAIDDTKHTVDIDYGSTETLPNIKVQYAIGYVGSWPPDPNQPAGDAVAKECNATSITWYDDYVTAKQAADAAGTAVSKVRMSADKMEPSQYMAMRIKHRARANFFSTNDPIPNKTLLVNYAVYKSSLTNDKYINNSYQPNDADQPHQGGWNGDRLIMQRAKVRILKQMNPTNVSPGSEPTVTLTPSFTVDGPNPQTDSVVIADLLPFGLEYKSGSTVGSYDNGTLYGEPTVYSPATDAECQTYAKTLVDDGKPCGTLNGGTGKESILVWDLGQQTTGTVYNDLNFTTVVTIDAPQGVLKNYAQIESPSDDSAPSKRIANANVNNSVPSSLLIVKSVLTPLHEINKDALLNWMEFKVGVRNGSSDPLSDLDIIDILPFNGDGTSGSFTFTPSAGTTIDRYRNPATGYHGTFQFDSMSFDDNDQECDPSNITYWYTNTTNTLDISPVASSNTDNNGDPTNIWCEGTDAGPNAACGFTNADVKAIRIRNVGMNSSSTCYLNIKYATQDNVDGDIYSNTAGAKAVGVTNAVLSNTVSAKVYASSIGDYVWYDKNKNGIQDAGETPIAGVKVHLLDSAGNPVTDPTIGLPYIVTTDANGKYLFSNLVHGDYKVKFDVPDGYLVSPKNASGNTAVDSDVNIDTNMTDNIILGENQDLTTIDMGLHTPVISGNIFDDGDGDINVNGTPIAQPDGTQLYATLLDNNGAVLASTPIATDGTYSFDGTDGVRANSNYMVVLSTAQNATTSTLPANWNNTGQNLNDSGAGNDGLNDGKISVSVGTNDVPKVDFGINHKPTADNKTEPSQANPGGNTQVSVPTLTGNDDESGTNLIYTITSLPTNATLYHANGTPVQVGDTVDPATLKVDPNDGDQTVVFTYTTTDQAGVTSDPATVTMPFTEVSISGNVFNDGDGDTNVNGSTINQPSGTQLHATLLDANGNPIATTPIAADGSYSFGTADGVQINSSYTVVLSTVPNATTPSLPTNWNNTGEQPNNTGTGNDGTPDGKVSVVVGTNSVPNNDFGINHKPTADNKTEPSQANPGGNTQVSVPTLTGNDDESGTNLIYTITSLPTNAILYHANGTPVQVGDTVDPATLKVDPNDGDQTVVFTYTTTDQAGVVSAPATVTMPFTDIGISGHVFDDGNGNNNVDGTAINTPSGMQLHANLVDASGNVVATKPIAADGTYSFDTTDGVQINTTYTIQLSTTAGTAGQPAPGASLPANWNNADGEQPSNSGTGTDGTADGVLTVNVGTTNLPNNDFGINHKPTASDVSEPMQNNPGGSTQVPVPPLVVHDTEDGTPTTITIKTLPNSGTLYYNGVQVTAGQVIPNFDPSKLTVDPNDGNVNITFTYTTTDRAGVESDPATVTMPFNVDGNITGKVEEVDAQGHKKPIANVILVLYNMNGEEIKRTKTDAHGNYEFTAVPPGNYYIQEAQPKDYYDVSEREGGADNEPSNPLINTINVTVSVGETDIHNDFVERKVQQGCVHNPVVACPICVNGNQKVYAYATQPDASTAKLYWSDAHDETAYDIYVNGTFVATVGKNVTSYTLKNLQSDAPYSVAIVARNAVGGVTAQCIVLRTQKVNAATWLPAIYNMLLN